ncbi:MAG: toxin glutamine deamidase domain-containing protein [Methylocella sp.]
MWPGIPLTEKRGAACVPIAADAARFWITRLHGPEAINTYVLHYLGAAARKLSEGDEAGAQIALDASGLTLLSSDGVALMRAVAGSLGIAPLDLPWSDGPRLWRPEVIDAHLPFFKQYAPAVDLLAKAGAWDESKHPRWPAGSADHQGGRFNDGEGGGEDGSAATETTPPLPPPRPSPPLPPPRPPGLALESAAAEVNPTNDGDNCGKIIDAVVARLRGTDPNATAPIGKDGTWDDIEQRFNTKFQWGQSLDSAYQEVAAGGDGTIGVIGIGYSDGKNSHVVVIANDHGTVGIVEGQNCGKGRPPGMITDPKEANTRYSPDGRSIFGFGILPRDK